MDIAYDRAADKDVLHRAQVWVFQLVQHHHVVEFDVQVLVDRFQRAPDTDVVLELDCHGLLGECFEEAVEMWDAWLVWIYLN